MIFDAVKRSLTSPRVLIPVEQLLNDAGGSRMPDVQPSRLTPETARRAAEVCPTAALAMDHAQLVLDYGECIGCGRCIEAGGGAFVAAAKLPCCGGGRRELVRRFDLEKQMEIASGEAEMESTAREIRALLGRALNIREVDTGSCNGCEAEIVALTNPYYDLERFGVHFVASPKHADMLLITGPVTRNMAEAVRQTYAATPSPKLVVAVGACGCGGGIFASSHAVAGPLDKIIPVDGFIPGCPPSPAMLLTGILRVLRRQR